MRAGFAYQTELDDAYVALFVVSHPDLSQPFRFTDAGAALTLGGDLYQHLPVQITLPDLTEENPPAGRLILDNVTRDLIAAIRTLSGPLAAEVTIVLVSDPTTPELGPFEFEVRNIRWGVLTLEADLQFEPLLGVAVPTDTFTAANFPGLFRT